MKMFEILELETILPKLTTKQLPIRTLYKLNKLIELVEREKTFYQDQFQSLVDIYAERDAAGNYVYVDETGSAVKILPDKIVECQSKMNELINIEIESVPNIAFTFDELDSLTLSYTEARPLMNFINE
jgi:hypothetical protein